MPVTPVTPATRPHVNLLQSDMLNDQERPAVLKLPNSAKPRG
jgi:hypothetical protein